MACHCETTRLYYKFAVGRDGLVPAPLQSDIDAGYILFADRSWGPATAAGDSIARSSIASAVLLESSDISAASSANLSQSTLISTADSKAVSAASGGGADSVARSSVASAVLLESSDISSAASANLSQSILISTADSKGVSGGTAAATADSKAVSDSAVISTNLSITGSQNTSQSTLISTATTNASVADSKAVSDSTVISTNLSTGNSKDVSQSTLISIAASKGDSAAGGSNDSVARSSVTSLATLEASDISAATSSNLSQSVLISSALSAANSAAGGSNDSIARSSVTSLTTLESSDISVATSKDTSQSTLISTATTNASVADSKAVSSSTVDSTNLSITGSQNTSQSTLISTATTNASAAQSVATSQNTSQSTNVSTAVTNASTADSKAVSDSVVISTNLSTDTSRNTSQSSNVSTADSKAVSVSIAPFVGGTSFRNRFVNGAVEVDQANAGAAVTVNNNAIFWAVDKFSGLGVSAAGVFTLQQLSATPPSGFINYLRATVSTADAAPATGSAYVLYHRIEGSYTADLQFGLSTTRSVALSFQVRSSLTGAFSGSLRNSAANRSYPFSFTIGSANTWTPVTVIIQVDQSGTWLTTSGIGISITFDLGSGTTLKSTAATWQAGNFVGVTGAASLMATLSATMDFTGFQIEPGTLAHDFERLPFAVTLQLCQREFCKSFLLATAPVQNAGGNTSEEYCIAGKATAVAQQLAYVRFPVTMRAAAAITTYNPAAVNAQPRNNTAAADCTSATVGNNTERGFGLVATTTVATAVGDQISFHWAADARL